MIERAFIHITGPSNSGKTTFIERLLEFSPSSLIVARCQARDGVRDFVETHSKKDPELVRYRKAGAADVARYRFKPGLEETDAFWDTDLMEDPAEVVVMEGDLPVPGADLTVYVTRPLPSRKRLVRLVTLDQKRVHEQKVKLLESLSEGEDGLEDVLRLLFGEAHGSYAPSDKLRARWQSEMRGIVAKARAQGPPPAEKKWAIEKGLEGIALAGVIVINVTDPKERKRGKVLMIELDRLRKDEEIFNDVIGPRGSRVPVMARIADLSDTGDTELKDVLRRVQRKIRDVTRRS